VAAPEVVGKGAAVRGIAELDGVDGAGLRRVVELPRSREFVETGTVKAAAAVNFDHAVQFIENQITSRSLRGWRNRVINRRGETGPGCKA
jgi:hypothetical protein